MTILQRFLILDKARNQFIKNSKKMAFWKHSIVILFGLIISTLAYIFIINSLNLSFKNPPTTTISWFTENSYPRQQDYFYFSTSFVFITILTSLIWMGFIWLRKSK